MSSRVEGEMKVRPGQRLASSVSSAEVVVVRCASEVVDLRCGGRSMVDPADGASSHGEPDGQWDGELQIGKRWQHDGAGLEVLVTKGGRGLLSIADDPLQLRANKQLPASD